MTILISRELNVVLDEDFKLVGEARVDVAQLNLEPVIKAVEELDLLSRELLSSLEPRSAPLISSRPRREGVYRLSGIMSNVALGFLIGSLAFSAITFAFYSLLAGGA